jgi:hypothetical protein
MGVQDEILELRERVSRLERSISQARGRTTQVGAAKYLGVSDETLRMRHAHGDGPRRTKIGRLWSYSFDDLDAYAEGERAP